MKSIKLFLILVALCALSGTASYAGDVVKDTLGTTASSVKTVEGLLQGQVAGVRVWSTDGSPMSASGVTIRGVNSLRGGQEPLYIVDGAMLNGSNAKNLDPLWQYEDESYVSPLSQLSFLVPNDIESIEVLKDAAATALYGSKGANGVVIITTKKIKDERSVISWDSNIDVATPLVEKGTGLGISHNHKVMVGGTKNDASYTLSGYFRDDNYVVPGTGSMKGGLRTSFETKANSVVWFGLNSSLNIGTTENAAAGAWYGKESYTMNMRNPEASVDGWAADYSDDVMDFRTVNSMWLQLNLAKGFTFKFDLGADYQFNNRNFWWGNGTPFGLENNAAAAILNTSSFAYNADAVLRYNTYFNQKHHLNVSLGAQAIGNWDVYNTMNGLDFYNHTLGYKSLNISASVKNIHKLDRNIFALGLIGAVSYDYDGIAGVDAAFRTDWNPEFGSWNMYPSVSVFWDVRKNFFADSDVVSALKINAGYGESGLEDAFVYEQFGAYTPSDYIDVEKRATPFYDGHWYIHNREWNVSLTFGMFDDRLSLTAGYYQRQTTDAMSIYCKGEKIMEDIPYIEDPETGESYPDPDFVPEFKRWQYKDREEISAQQTSISNKGVELSLTGVPVKTADWTWSINVNGAYNVNTISKLAAEDAGGKAVGHFTTGEGEEAVVTPIIPTNNIEGFPVSSIVDADGAVIGNPTPKYYGGLGTTLRWKELTLDILADGAADFDILNLNSMAAAGATAVSSEYVEKGDFFRLARVSLAYNIPVKKVKWLEGIKLFATASNLAVVSDYSGWSPDVNSYAASNFRLGMDYGSYPAARSFVLGFNIKF